MMIRVIPSRLAAFPLAAALVLASCNLPLPAGEPSPTPPPAATAVPLPTETLPEPTFEPTPPGASPTAPATPTLVPPPGGVSLQCDGTFQRFRLTDAGVAGRTASVDSWDGSSWVNVWNWAGGDPMIKQIEDEAGLYSFGGCEQLVVIPERFVGSGAILQLTIHRWNGAGLTEVFFLDGVHGSWSLTGDGFLFEESVYLYGEPNCCPCNRQYLQYSWNGAAFDQTGSAVNPTYTGTPPAECTP
ncbi:MAG TPA: hypothetical protein VJJ46_09150 [Anaerolineales bacterium]|nr:hypothetical protein [Anaerolineales bacterium]